MLFKQYLESRGACQDAVDWAGGKTLDDCWQTCDRPDWMLWLYERNTPDKMTCVKIAVYAARLVLPIWQEKYPEDLRPQRAIEAAEKWVENLSEETRQAAVAAGAAREAARVAGDNVNKTVADYIRTLIPTINIPEVTDEKSV